MYRIGIDIGGTNTVVGIVDDSNNILSSISFRTGAPRSAQSLCDEIDKTARKAAAAAGIRYEEIDAVGAACPGAIADGICVFANNLAFENEPLAAILSKTMGKPAILCNDANAAAFGEHTAGCGKGRSSLVMLTIGTGIGGGIVLDNRLYTGCGGLGGEMGHFIVAVDGKPCSCGSRGCIETYCSATALIESTRVAMRQSPDSLLWQEAPSPDKVNGRTAFRAAEKGDAAAQAVLERFFDFLAVGVYNIIVLFQPQVVCIGGGMSREGDRLLEPVRKRISENRLGAIIGSKTEILAARLYGDAGLIGAAALAAQRFLK